MTQMSAFALTYSVRCTMNDTGNAEFKLTTTNAAESRVNGTGFLQLSKYSDFRTSEYIVKISGKNGTTEFGNQLPYTYTLESSELENGTYYWRVFYLKSQSENKMPYTGNKPVTFGSKVAEPKPETTVDNNEYETFDLENGMSVYLEPVWLRSENSDTPLSWNTALSRVTTSTPRIVKPTDADYIPYSHGIVVRDGIIYIARGSALPLGWNFEKTQLEIDRYDLNTGKQLETITVASNEGFFTGTSAMGLLGEDNDGTIYFTTAELSDGLLKEVRLYSVDISTDDTDNELASLSAIWKKDFPMTTTGANIDVYNSHLFVVDGSIAKNSYTLWGCGSSTSEQEIDNFSDIAIRWKVDGNNQTFEYASIKEASFMHETYPYKGMLGRITPLGDNDFYYQCGSSGEYNNTMAPGLYRFDAESNSCSMLGNASEISGIALPKSLHNIIGVSSFNIENNKFIAFGTPSSNGSTLTVAEITSSGERQFKEAKKLWTINSTGFSHNPLQGCDMKYISMPIDARTQTSGQLLAYVPNGGMALYNVVPDSTTGIDPTCDDNNGRNPYLSGRTLFTGTDKGICQIFDTAGSCVTTTSCDKPIDLSRLPSGIYIVKLSERPSPYKIAL